LQTRLTAMRNLECNDGKNGVHSSGVHAIGKAKQPRRKRRRRCHREHRPPL